MFMGVDDSMSEHINKMKELASQLEAVGASITAGERTLVCLRLFILGLQYRT